MGQRLESNETLLFYPTYLSIVHPMGSQIIQLVVGTYITVLCILVGALLHFNRSATSKIISLYYDLL